MWYWMVSDMHYSWLHWHSHSWKVELVKTYDFWYRIFHRRYVAADRPMSEHVRVHYGESYQRRVFNGLQVGSASSCKTENRRVITATKSTGNYFFRAEKKVANLFSGRVTFNQIQYSTRVTITLMDKPNTCRPSLGPWCPSQRLMEATCYSFL